MEEMTRQKARAAEWFRALRDEIVAAFEGLERGHAEGPFAEMEPSEFELRETSRPGGGGGLMSVMRGGRVFEKVGVNVSEVHGTLDPRAQAAMMELKTMSPKESRAIPVTDPPNQSTSPYAIRMMVRFLKIV